MGRATRRGKSYAGLAAIGAGLMGGYQFITDEEKRKAQERREASLLALKNKELGLASRRLDEEAAARKDRSGTQAMDKFLNTDLPGWQAKYVGTDADAKLREAAWEELLTMGALQMEGEDFAEAAARIEAQFGTGEGGKPVLTAKDIEEGMAALRTRAELRGIGEDVLTPDRLRSLITSGFEVGGESDPNAVGEESFGEVGVEGGDAGLMDAAPQGPTGPRYQSLSEAVFGEDNPDAFQNVTEQMFEPWFRRGSALMDLYDENVAVPVQKGINKLGGLFGAGTE